MEAQDKGPQALTVSQAASLVQKHLEAVHITIEGETSQVTDKAGYSAVYFTVKDEGASLECKMWMNRYRAAGVKLKVGMMVRISGRFTYYGRNGKFSFDVFSLQPSGEGVLRMQVAQLAERLRREGLMDQERKRALPAYPQRIGLVTSPRGAAVRDVLRTLRRRYPLAEVLVCGVPVEGKGAADHIAQGVIDAANAGAEVILLVRGGGSFENLMPFNDENLARTVAACPVPVVTGIGHEPDNSICDMVADRRESTPTSAAESVTPTVDSILESLDRSEKRMVGYFRHKLDVTRLYLEKIAQRPIFEEPDALLASRGMALDQLQERLERSLPAALASEASRLDALDVRLHAAIPANLTRDAIHLKSLEERLPAAMEACLRQNEGDVNSAALRLRAAMPANLSRAQAHLEAHANRLPRAAAESLQRRQATLQAALKRLAVSGGNMLVPFEHQVGLKAARLDDLSPLAVLGRGYSIARDGQGSIVRSVSQAPAGSSLHVSVSDGTLDCTVDAARANPKTLESKAG